MSETTFRIPLKSIEANIASLDDPPFGSTGGNSPISPHQETLNVCISLPLSLPTNATGGTDNCNGPVTCDAKNSQHQPEHRHWPGGGVRPTGPRDRWWTGGGREASERRTTEKSVSPSIAGSACRTRAAISSRAERERSRGTPGGRHRPIERGDSGQARAVPEDAFSEHEETR
ncbi:hypothetical protein HN011_002660 [Eciton burchellii]|nr:hypothetical protein HN011_002660 [Eciton burchellii]